MGVQKIRGEERGEVGEVIGDLSFPGLNGRSGGPNIVCVLSSLSFLGVINSITSVSRSVLRSRLANGPGKVTLLDEGVGDEIGARLTFGHDGVTSAQTEMAVSLA